MANSAIHTQYSTGTTQRNEGKELRGYGEKLCFLPYKNGQISMIKYHRNVVGMSYFLSATPLIYIQ
jgi:hypothetical protein